MTQIDWKNSLEGEPLAEVYGFALAMSGKRLLEEGVNLEEAYDVLYSAADKFVLLIWAGWKSGNIEILGDDVALLDDFNQTYIEISSLQYKQDLFHGNEDGEAFAVKYNTEGRLLVVLRRMEEIKRHLQLGLYVRPMDAATWIASTNKGKQLLPQSLLDFFVHENDPQIVLTPPVNGIAKEENAKERKPGGSNKNFPHRAATDAAFEAVYASIDAYLDKNEKIDRPSFNDIMKQTIKNQTAGERTTPHGVRCSEHWKSEAMEKYRLKRGEKTSRL